DSAAVTLCEPPFWKQHVFRGQFRDLARSEADHDELPVLAQTAQALLAEPTAYRVVDRVDTVAADLPRAGFHVFARRVDHRDRAATGRHVALVGRRRCGNHLHTE